MIVIAIIFLLFSSLFLFLTEPRKSEKSQYSKFAGRNYTHRGLYTKDQTVPENSLKAFELSCEADYGIEFDVHLMRDGTLAICHDNDVFRVCGEHKMLSEMTFDELKKLRLFETDECIPTLSEMLEVVSGRVPLIVELKVDGNNYNELASAVWSVLKDYKGLYCIESFDPRAVAWFNRHQQNVYRGQLCSSYESLKRSAPKLGAFAVSHMLSNFLTRPHFIAHSREKKSIPVRLCELMGARSFVWANDDESKTSEYQLNNDGVIFEFYKPGAKFYKEL